MCSAAMRSTASGWTDSVALAEGSARRAPRPVSGPCRGGQQEPTKEADYRTRHRQEPAVGATIAAEALLRTPGERLSQPAPDRPANGLTTNVHLLLATSPRGFVDLVIGRTA